MYQILPIEVEKICVFLFFASKNTNLLGELFEKVEICTNYYFMYV